VALVAAVGIGVLALLPVARPGGWIGLLVALVLQAPLGWWAVRSLGTEQFLLVWGSGLVVRLAIVGLVGFIVVPALGLPPGPTLLALVGALVGLLVVEGITAWLELSQGTA
jgi:hypothetical protein